MRTSYFLLLTILVCASCSTGSQTRKVQKQRNNIVNVHDKIKEIIIPEDEVIIGPNPALYVIDSILIITDPQSPDKLLHLFDVSDFKYRTSIGDRGQGPNEITNLGYIGVDEPNRKFYAADNGKLLIYSYCLDSVLTNPLYNPGIKFRMNPERFPITYHYMSDTLSIGLILDPIGHFDYTACIAKINFQTGEITAMNTDELPDLEDKKRKELVLAVSVENNRYILCYMRADVMTVCNLNGELICNIYGPNFPSQDETLEHFGSRVASYNNTFIVPYSGGKWNTHATKLMVFDTDGNYIKTLETGYSIIRFGLDKKHNRLILALNEAEIQFAYLPLEGLVE